jgi:L-alanine-DL-glutamate epimerase-like enolase superfamily enzyme
MPAERAALRPACVEYRYHQGATLHVLAAMEEVEYMEYCVQTTDLNQRLVAERFLSSMVRFAIPSGPGLGIELDEAVLKQFAVQ